ncbi:MAG: alpha/beta fold hydrolase [Candidatus Thorarchaeota archaeon]
MRIQRKWMNVYGGALYGQKNTWPLLKVFFRSPEYSLRDIWKFFMGIIFSLKTMWNEYCHNINFIEDFTQWSIPVFFLAGRSDYNTPFELVERYYHTINAPYKELVWFEKSAHSPSFEEPEKFDQIMIEKILPIIDEKR